MRLTKCAIYVRCSTIEQSTEMQLSELREYAKDRGWTIYKVYEDKATGTNTNRPLFQEMLKDAHSKKFAVVAVWKLDRFARSLKDLVIHLQELTDLGIGFVSMKDAGVDLTTPTGRLLTHLLSAFSEFEASLIRMRVKSGLDMARKRGKKLGRPKRRDDAEILKLRAEGHSLRKIAAKLHTSMGAVQRAIAASKSSF